MQSTYLRFLALAQAINSSSEHNDVDETAKQLLNVISVNHAEGKSMTVTDAMALSSIASPATIHRKIDDLRNAGLIEQTFEGKNRRTKYLSPTSLANSRFETLGEAMKQSISIS
jgi:DNA-binding MarR family transcriptional regulator